MTTATFIPPKEHVEYVYQEVRDLGRGSVAVQSAIDAFEKAYGPLKDALSRIDWTSPDTAWLIGPANVVIDGVKQTVMEPVRHNVMPGNLVTALERGFLPLALADYEKAIAATGRRRQPRERASQAESQNNTEKKE